MACSTCNTGCNSCNPCGGNDCNKCCITPCLQWGLDGCFLRGRCPDGSELNPLDLCEWLHKHETCTDFSLVVDGGGDNYMKYANECGEIQKIYICDFLSLGDLECLGNVVSEEAQPCDLLVYDPSCGEECSKTYEKWTHYHIPDAGDCVLEPDEEGYYHVLVKNECGCIVECKVQFSDKVYEYGIRDSYPDDPDWPFTIGSRQGDNRELIDLHLEAVPEFGKRDLEVTYEYAFGVQNSIYLNNYNFKSLVTPVNRPDRNAATPALVATKSTVIQLNNLSPWGSWEGQCSRTVIVPKGEKLYLVHQVDVRDLNTNIIPYGGTFEGTPPAGIPGSSRLHALRVVVSPCDGKQLTVEQN